MEYQGMTIETIENELERWENEGFLAKVEGELGEYVGKLDKILYERYKGKIKNLQQNGYLEDSETALDRLKARNLIDDKMNYIGDPNIVSLDSDAEVTNGGFYKGKIIVNPDSAKQFYAAYIDFSNGITDGIRNFDYTQPLCKLDDLSSLEILYWHYANGKTYQDFLKSTMLHENVHRWTLSADFADSSIDTFTMEGLVETEAREVAEENNIEYAHCFRNDEVNLINFFSRYSKVDRTNIMLSYTTDNCLMGMIAMTICGEIESIDVKDVISLRSQIYSELSSIARDTGKSSVGKNYREVFAGLKPDKSNEMIAVIKQIIDKQKPKQTTTSILQSGVEATEQSTTTEEINSQAQTLKRENQRGIDEQEQSQT